MAYFKPYIDSGGLHIPSYSDIRDNLIAEFRKIYGDDIYLDNDSQDYQMISIFAAHQFDTLQMLELVYNNRSPKTAIGSALDTLVKLNGIRRKKASHSTCELTLSGDAGSVIVDGVAEDEAGNKWNLPSTVIIGEGGSVKVTAVSADIGAIPATVGSIKKISTPTKGWISVTNNSPAILGDPIETDEQLRYRQSISAALPSRSMMEGLVGSLAALENVKRYKVYENDTNQTDLNGIPSHSIAVVIEGGIDSEIAKTIYMRKGPGCGTHGTETYNYYNSEDIPTPIKFTRPSAKSVYVNIKVKKLFGYTNDIESDIKAKVSAYIDTLDIGQTIYISSVWAAALTAISDIGKPTFSITEVKLGTSPGSYSSSDIKLAYTEVGSAKGVNVEGVS